MSPEELMGNRLTDIRNSILNLKATGSNGFEGFLSIVLFALTGIPFRLAASGLQGGKDGDAALQDDMVCFEAKRYSDDIPRNEVLAKIVDLARNNNSPDRLWILGATTAVSVQLASAVKEAGNQHAISTFILDWAEDTLPLLAVAVVAAGDPAIDFLSTHCSPKSDRNKLSQTFKNISKHSEFSGLLQKIQSNLAVSTLALARSVELNTLWRAESFGSDDKARERLGQALSVNSQTELRTLRSALRDQVRTALQVGQSIFLSGGEGHGKSWLAAQICSDHKGIALFASAEQFDGVTPDGMDELLVNLLIKQTRDVADDVVKRRWRHRLSAWQNQPPASSLLVVIDGINQRQSLRWDKILNSLQNRLKNIGGRLVVTVRPLFWQKTVAPGVTFKPKLIEVPEWSQEERDQLLKHYNIRIDWLDDATLETLRNPRLLGVAVSILPHQNSAAWKGLTTDRLLMEHLRASQRENFEEETLTELTTRLSNHAKEVLERVRSESKGAPQNFEAESIAVIETRFFLSFPGPGNTYELRSEGLTLALGYALIDQLWQAQRSNGDLGERITHLIDPIYAMDRTVDVMFAALIVCALDPIRFHQDIFAVLLDAFSNLQNIHDQRFEEFVETVKNQPTELFSTLRNFTLERGRRLNQDWFIHAAFEIAGTDDGWPVAEVAIRQWLHCYNKNAVDQMNRYPKQNDNEDANRLKEIQTQIQNILSSLSPFESDLLAEMTEVVGETDSLFTLALQLLAGHPLAGFSSSFIALGLGFSLDRNIFSARKAFQQLTAFNRIDREASKEAFLKAIEPLRSCDTSQAGQWTVVRMLYATGDEAAASEAFNISQKLREDWGHWENPSPDEWRQSRIADPSAIRPIDIDEGVRNFCAIPPNSVFQSMGQTMEDHRLEEFLPVACRFQPEAAVKKARQLMVELLTRTAFPLRQLTLNGAVYTPLMTRDIAKKLMDRVAHRETNILETLTDREQNIVRMFLFSHAAPLLTSSEQLKCMIDPAFGSDYLLDVIPSLQLQSSEEIQDILHLALKEDDEETASRALAAAYYGGAEITPKLESLLLQCRAAKMSKLRARSFMLAIENDLKALRDAHVHSDWSADSTEARAHENWFGSALLAEACSKDEIAIDELLKRISPEAWFMAAERVGEKMLKPLAACFLSRLKGAIDAIKALSPPSVDITLSTAKPIPYALLSIDESSRNDSCFPRQKTPEEMFGEKKDFDEEQERLRAIYNDFFQKIDGSDARFIIDKFSIEEIRALVKADPFSLPTMLEALERSGTEFIWLKSIAFVVANLVSADMPKRAVALFHRAMNSEEVITYALGDGLTIEHEAVWSSSQSEEMKALWRQRLLKSCNDEVLALEVSAAEKFGAASFIKAFVEESSVSQSALDQAYAISIAGFSKQSDELVGVIERHLDNKGITGGAARNAEKSHEEALWIKKWINDMCAASSQEEFWRCLMISKTCMDARVSAEQLQGTKWAHYSPLFKNVRKAALEEQNKTRKKTLVGQEAPEVGFIKF